ncbi:CIC11C00000002021 [Sungouiella intermedia]|uniref:non-specific serine/threonine protein kinase n=1 Tax=Sungouiella intermedia TaxID=45354 RepID=A0A1L0BPQ6_9ASCO|nr:CIC11C00000002021 [[Candida] intermedia]
MDRIFSSDELEVCEEVGRGGFGVVYRGIVKATGVEVAIKQIDLENDQVDIFEVNKEIQILSECQLAQITRYIGCFVKGYKLWVIMEYVNGGSLFDLLRPGPIQDEKTIAIVAHQILLALDYLHALGKIHRDLKSQNILLSQNGEVKLTDFGVSTQLYSNFSRRNTTVGTPYWMAPEVIMNNMGGHGYKADIWSLGCCMYELANGKPPLQDHYAPMKALRKISTCKTNADFLELIQMKSHTEWSDRFKDFLSKCFILEAKNRLSASRLLKHKFVEQVVDISPEVRRKLLKKLITNKLLWDQENHIVKTQKFYAPTEIALNQEKWRNGSIIEQTNAVQFDLSSISELQEVSPSKPAFKPPSATRRETSISPAGSTIYSKSESPQVNLVMKGELVKTLNKVFHKMEQKVNLTTEQYDDLVSLNDRMIKLFMPIQYSDSNSQTRILICQYLKYFLKEISKQTQESTRSLLQRLIIPSNLLNTEAYSEPKRKISGGGGPMEEISRNLMESWLEKMSKS